MRDYLLGLGEGVIMYVMASFFVYLVWSVL